MEETIGKGKGEQKEASTGKEKERGSRSEEGGSGNREGRIVPLVSTTLKWLSTSQSCSLGNVQFKPTSLSNR